MSLRSNDGELDGGGRPTAASGLRGGNVGCPPDTQVDDEVAVATAGRRDRGGDGDGDGARPSAAGGEREGALGRRWGGDPDNGGRCDL